MKIYLLSIATGILFTCSCYSMRSFSDPTNHLSMGQTYKFDKLLSQLDENLDKLDQIFINFCSFSNNSVLSKTEENEDSIKLFAKFKKLLDKAGKQLKNLLAKSFYKEHISVFALRVKKVQIYGRYYEKAQKYSFDKNFSPYHHLHNIVQKEAKDQIWKHAYKKRILQLDENIANNPSFFQKGLGIAEKYYKKLCLWYFPDMKSIQLCAEWYDLIGYTVDLKSVNINPNLKEWVEFCCSCSELLQQ